MLTTVSLRLRSSVRSEAVFTEMAEDGAIRVFGKNLEQLLMQPPIAGQVVLGWDPAFRTGCKLAVVDPTGKRVRYDCHLPDRTTEQSGRGKDGIKKILFPNIISH